MKDKCLLVTGSSSGIGRAITIKLLDSGAKVIAGQDPEAAAIGRKYTNREMLV